MVQHLVEADDMCGIDLARGTAVLPRNGQSIGCDCESKDKREGSEKGGGTTVFHYSYSLNRFKVSFFL